jgi:hypothetical protein
MGRIACNNGTIDGSDRYAGDPVRMDIGFGQGLVDASLVCPQRSAALQEQGDALEWKTLFRLCQMRSGLEIHGSFFRWSCVLTFALI